MKGATVLVALVLLGTVSAAADPADVSAVIRGSLTFDDGVHVDVRATPHAIFFPDTSATTNLHGDLPTVNVTIRQDQSVAASPLSTVQIPPTYRESSWTLRGARVSLLLGGNASGTMGIFPNPEAGVSAELGGRPTLRAATVENYGVVGAGTGEQPSEYRVRVNEAHVVAEGNGTLWYVGPGRLLLHGLDVVIQAAENTTELRTGDTYETLSTGVQIETQSWAYLEFPAGTLRIDSAAPFVMAMAEADMGWSGAAEGTPEPGTLVLDGDQQDASSGTMQLDGDFTGHVMPESTPNGARMHLSATRQAPAATPLEQVAGPLAWPLGAIVLVAVAVGAGTLGAWALHRRTRAPLEVEEMLTLAHLAGEGGRHDEALQWVRRARGVAPQSGALALEEAFHLGELGLVDEALAAYRDAARLSDDGQAEFDAALFGLASGGMPVTEAEALLVVALEKNPGLVLELEDSRVARTPHGWTAELGTAVRKAHRRLDAP